MVSSKKRSSNSPSSKLEKMKVNKKQLKGSSSSKKNKGAKDKGCLALIRKKAKGGGVKMEYSLVDKNTLAMRRAQKIQAQLAPGFPSLVKFMLRSHVTGGYWLGLPKSFCTHLPKHDATIILVDGDDKEWEIKYLVEKSGFSGGWRGFSIAHNLIPGDVLIYQLVESCKFQVYIVRENDSTDDDFAAISLLNLRHQPLATEKQQPFPELTRQGETKVNQESSMSEHGPTPSHVSANASDEDEDEGLRLADSAPDFSQAKDFKSFCIFANGLIIDSEIPRDLRAKYYQLCRTQNSYLHQHLIEGLNYKLIAGIISETVNIADAIRASKLTAPGCQHLEAWDTTLKGFECLGMGVQFLRERLQKLISLSYESSENAASKRRERRTVLKDELKDLRSKMSKMKEAMQSLDDEIELYSQKDRVETMFRDVATAPW
ncbi:unnamed protein product [Cuscuta epithymum]|uniref:TF-B3 domain-containing protein n=1 Tax=Cuscuta epithymum TaxID=186058 RepID=A0AAV0F188_9ASTE|nr:unnamed protein product [Cuscuta epithymum]CAH9129114.1 unnamed protein product [Cuscuta epithymum]